MEPETTVIETPTPIVRKKKDDSLNVPLAIVIAGLLISGSIIYTNNGSGSAAPTQVAGALDGAVDVGSKQIPLDLLTVKDDDHILGDANADVVIIEYSDTECPFCKRFHDTMLQVMDTYGKEGTVAWVYRYFPLDMHPRGRKESEALECAFAQGGNDAFWKYNDKIFEITPANNGLDPEMLPKIAAMIGLDGGKLATCLDSGKFAARVQRDFENGANVGVHGTPYSIAWNRKTGKQAAINGAYPFTNVQSILNTLIEKPAK
jgi:protein-disulfide isomerase